MAPAKPTPSTALLTGEWIKEEHHKYLESLQRFPKGPWKARAAFVGTRTTRQIMTHAQKIALRLQRHAQGLKKPGRPRGDRRDSHKCKTEPTDHVAIPKYADAYEIQTNVETTIKVNPISSTGLVCANAVVLECEEPDWDLIAHMNV